MFKKLSAHLSAGLFFALLCQSASADNSATYTLHDHPDGSAAPPFYGLRLDGLFTDDASDINTFSFSDKEGGGFDQMSDAGYIPFGTTAPSVEMTIDNNDPDNVTIVMSGTVYGGPDIGTMWDFTDPNTTLWEFYFEMTQDVNLLSDDAENPIATAGEPPDDIFLENMGYLKNTDTDEEFALVSYRGGYDFAFYLTSDGNHRLDNLSEVEQAQWALTIEGWGWVNHGPIDGDLSTFDHLKASDFLFTGEFSGGQLVPEPSTYAGIIILGLAGFIFMKRRRA